MLRKVLFSFFIVYVLSFGHAEDSRSMRTGAGIMTPLSKRKHVEIIQNARNSFDPTLSHHNPLMSSINAHPDLPKFSDHRDSLQHDVRIAVPGKKKSRRLTEVEFENQNSVPTSVPTSTPTSAPSSTPTAIPTSTPTAVPTSTPTAVPTSTPTAVPTSTPTAIPTLTPTAVPTFHPTATPTAVPTCLPTSTPTAVPSSYPTGVPTVEPTAIPTSNPTAAGSSKPTLGMTSAPTIVTTIAPTSLTTAYPTTMPGQTDAPVAAATYPPSIEPSASVTASPSAATTSLPTSIESSMPSSLKTMVPSHVPSARPTFKPILVITQSPSRVPTPKPSLKPGETLSPTLSLQPTQSPTLPPPEIRVSATQSISIPVAVFNADRANYDRFCAAVVLTIQSDDTGVITCEVTSVSEATSGRRKLQTGSGTQVSYGLAFFVHNNIDPGVLLATTTSNLVAAASDNSFNNAWVAVLTLAGITDAALLTATTSGVTGIVTSIIIATYPPSSQPTIAPTSVPFSLSSESKKGVDLHSSGFIALWVIISVIGAAAVILAVYFYFYRSTNLKYQLNDSDETVVQGATTASPTKPSFKQSAIEVANPIGAEIESDGSNSPNKRGSTNFGMGAGDIKSRNSSILIPTDDSVTITVPPHANGDSGEFITDNDIVVDVAYNL